MTIFTVGRRRKKNSVTKNALDDEFKHIITNGDILARILSGNIDELGDMKPDDIKKCLELGADGNTVIMRDREYFSRREGKTILDAAFDLKIPGTDGDVSVIIGIEGQANPNPGYPLGKRAEYYVARMVSAQRKREFKGNDYGKIRKVYSIWCVLNPKAKDRNTVTRYSMEASNLYGDERTTEKLDTFNIIFINVGGFEEELPPALSICAAMFSRMEAEERMELVEDKFNIKLDDEELERLNKMSDLAQGFMDYGHDVGIAEGIAEGSAKERAAAMDRSAETIVNLVRLSGMSFEEASSMVVIPEEDRAETEAEARRRLADRS